MTPARGCFQPGAAAPGRRRRGEQLLLELQLPDGSHSAAHAPLCHTTAAACGPSLAALMAELAACALREDLQQPHESAERPAVVTRKTQRTAIAQDPTAAPNRWRTNDQRSPTATAHQMDAPLSCKAP